MSDAFSAPSTQQVSIIEAPLDAEQIGTILRSVEGATCGAVVLFLGNVRDHHQGRSVEAITYTAYRSMAEQRLARIVDDLSQDGSDAELKVAIHHRLGKLEVGETSVVIAAASAHREEAYAASRQALERLKAEVPIWKREHYADGGSTWREEESLVKNSESA